MSVRAAFPPFTPSTACVSPPMTTTSTSAARHFSSAGVTTTQAGPSRRPVDRFPNQHLADTVLSSDEGLAAYLLSSLCCHCENCGRTDTPQWRKGWYSVVLQKHVLLCNACGLKYSKSQFCPYCYFVYSKNEDRRTEAKHQWLSCSMCTRWVHRACEDRYGGGSYCVGSDLKCVDPKRYTCPKCTHHEPLRTTTIITSAPASPSTSPPF